MNWGATFFIIVSHTHLFGLLNANIDPCKDWVEIVSIIADVWRMQMA